MKYFCEALTTPPAKSSVTGTVQSATSVSCQLIESIMISTPISEQIEVISCVMLWLRLWLSVSTSFVMRESTSPWLVLWKKETGRRLIFCMIAVRMLYETFAETPAIVKPWI